MFYPPFTCNLIPKHGWRITKGALRSRLTGSVEQPMSRNGLLSYYAIISFYISFGLLNCCDIDCSSDCSTLLKSYILELNLVSDLAQVGEVSCIVSYNNLEVNNDPLEDFP